MQNIFNLIDNSDLVFYGIVVLWLVIVVVLQGTSTDNTSGGKE